MRIQDEVLAEIFRNGLTARQVPKDANGNYIRGGLMQMRPQMMRLMKLTVENFRAFRGETTFDFNGRNVLIYGENGSGKTSVWSALDLFLNSATADHEAKSRATFVKHRHQFCKKTEFARVEFEVLDEFGLMEDIPRTTKYVWSRDESPFQSPEIMPSARVSARLDYRSLWETYFLQRKKSQVDIWPLLINVLIPHVETITGPTFQTKWALIKKVCAEGTKAEVPQYSWPMSECLTLRSEIEFALAEIKKYADHFLSILCPGFGFDWEVIGAWPSIKGILGYKEELGFEMATYSLKSPQVILSAFLNDQPLKNHHNLLNEARLSALALSIYLAAAKINAAQARSGFKILALDDVLIGLDMSNRMPVLDVLEDWFSDWQIFLFTYDRAWYELAKSRLNKNKWKKFEFYAGGEVPVWGEDCAALEKSKKYLSAANELKIPDYKAAGVWARSAFEWMMKWFCDKHAVPVPYCLNERFLKAETLWQTLKQLEVEVLEKQGAPLTKRNLISDEIGDGVSRCKSQHLNPLCHANLNSFDAKEIENSIKALEALQIELGRDYRSVSLPQKNSVAAVKEKITDYDIENLPQNVREAIYRRAGKSLGYLSGETKKEGRK